jgi:formylglycine-generating enzyme required for sulfatase activity
MIMSSWRESDGNGHIPALLAGLRSFIRGIGLLLAFITAWIIAPATFKSTPSHAIVLIGPLIGSVYSYVTTLRYGFSVTRTNYEDWWFYETPNQLAGILWFSANVVAQGALSFVKLGFINSFLIYLVEGISPGLGGVWPLLKSAVKPVLFIYGGTLLVAGAVRILFMLHVDEREAAYATDPTRYKVPEPEMIRIPAGEFLMGSDDHDIDEAPLHKVYLPTFWIAECPVINAEYKRFELASGHKSYHERPEPDPGKGRHPVVMVSNRDARAYCEWLSRMTGKPYRLPTEAEWEKAARGSDGRIWPWGNTWDPSKTNTEEGGKGDTIPVGSYPDGASPYGLLDMAGNVANWTSSVWAPYPYDSNDGREDPGSFVSRWRTGFVARGTSSHGNRDSARCSCRGLDILGVSIPPYGFGIGFRVALTLPES